ncbi:rhodanese-like domain-containing protein [Pseudoneobacillus sp. C159]
MNIRKISPQELQEKLKKDETVLILDVRSEDKFMEYHIETSTGQIKNIVKTKIFENGTEVDGIPTNQEIIVTCTTGNSAEKCAAILSEKNERVAVLEGGITAWKEYIKTL